jgi:hypothetical protein
MFRHWLCSGLCLAVASTGLAADRKKQRPVAGLRLGPETTIISTPLNDLGYPDYVTALNDRLSEGVAPEENFWTAYDETLPRNVLGDNYFRQLVATPGFERASTITWASYCPEGTDADKANKQLDIAMSRPWKAGECPIIASWLEKNRPALDRITEATRRPKSFAPSITGNAGETMAHVLLPHVQQTRDAARAFNARAFLALSEGRTEDAWQDVLTIQRLAKHQQSSPFVIGSLVGLAISAIGRIPAEAVIAEPSSTPEATLRRWKELAETLGRESRDNSWLMGERFCTLDLTLAIRSARAEPADILGNVTVISPLGTESEGSLFEIDLSKARQSFQSAMLTLGDVNESLIYTNRYLDRIADAFAEPDYLDRRAALQAAQKEFLDGKNPDDLGQVATAFLFGGPDAVSSIAQASVAHHFAATYLQCNNAEARQIARTRLLHAAFAAELHYQSTGTDVTDSGDLDRAIEKFAALAGVTLPEVKDPHSRASFRVMRDDERLVIYGIGENGRSDGGKTFGEGEGCDDLVVVLKRGL